MSRRYGAAGQASAFSEQAGRVSDLRDFFILTKPRVNTLVVFTGIIGLVMAPGSLHPFMALMVILSIALGSGGAGVLNMWYERDTDALMERTKGRPLPAGRIEPADAFVFGMILCLVSLFLLGLAANWYAAFWLGFSIAFYVVVYTIWLKRRSSWNIVIGGAAGALAPVIGWVAVEGRLSFLPLVMFLLIFLWTPPHFWALALVSSDDYQRAGIPMLPVVRSKRETRIQIFLYSLLMALAALLPVGFSSLGGGLGPVYLFGSLSASAVLVWLAASLLWRPEDKKAWRLFWYSILYLFILFTLMPLSVVL